MRLFKPFWCIIIFFYTISAEAQNFRFLKGWDKGRVLNLSTEPNGGCSFLFAFGPKSSNDTLKLGNFQYISTSTQSVNFLVRIDSIGTVTKVRYIGTQPFNYMTRDKDGNFYLLSDVSTQTSVDSLTLYGANGRMAFAKYDNNLKLIWVRQHGGGNDEPSPYDLFYSEGHILFTCRAMSNSVKLGSKTFSFSKTSFINGEINPNDGSIKWCNNYFKSYSPSYEDYQISGMAYLDGYIYITGAVQNNKNIFIGKDTFKVGALIIQTDSLGNYLKGFSIPNLDKNTIPSSFGAITSDGDYLYLSAGIIDTFIWAGKKIPPQYPSGYKFKESYVISLTLSLEPRWIFPIKVTDNTKVGGGFSKSVTNEGYIYFVGSFFSKIVILGDTLIPSTSNGDVMIMKIDHLGNLLWITSGGSEKVQNLCLDAIAGKYVYVGGVFEKQIKFGSFKENAVGKQDGWILKIQDNSIFRGNIYKGPYCAGDTIKVPYTKEGDFDTSNYFIAELSDEEGNFESGFRELGRVKSNNSGTIIGRLPLFQVSTSGKYRIRIRSTYPRLQSFYRIDTLRLLIYSKDKADPGPPETICKGDTLKLNTYGGTKWTWGPNYNINNIHLRQPFVWPMKDTIYKIIISDSSGCGKPDTAFKKTLVRPYPETNLKFQDTAICDNLTLKIPVKFTGGDSAYQWQMYYVTPSKWFYLKSGTPKPNDTLEFTTGVDASNNDKIAIVLRDGCTSKPDTTYLTISLSIPVALKTKFKDTLLCFGNKLVRLAKPTSALPKNAKWLWKDLNTNTILSSKDTLSIVAKQTSKIQLTLTNGCVTDTNTFILYVNPPLKANILTSKGTLHDTILCLGESLKLFSKGKGGSGSGYNFKWYLDKILLSTSDTFSFISDTLYPKSGGTKVLELVLKDNCTALDDSTVKSIKVIESPKSDFSVGSTCSLNPIQFTFTGTKPSTPITTRFSWNFAGEGTSTNENPTQKISAGKRRITLQATASNGCIDILERDLDIKPQATADFDAEDACEDTFAVFINKTKITSGTANYKWSFGDGKISTLDNPDHKYDIGGISKTFNVKMAANIPNGCSDSITKAVTINAIPKPGFTYTISGQTVNFTATETSASNYHWTFGDGGTANTNNRSKSYTYSKFPSGKYTACLTTTNIAGCSSDSCMEIFISGGIEEMNSMGIKIYPNPNSGSFTIEIPNLSSNAQIQLFDCIGQQVYEKTAFETLNKIATQLTEGVYILKITNGEMIYTQRILIDK